MSPIHERPDGTAGPASLSTRSIARRGRAAVWGSVAAAIALGGSGLLPGISAATTDLAGAPWPGPPLLRGPAPSAAVPIAALTRSPGLVRSDRIVVKFSEGSSVRLRAGRLTSTTGAADLAAMERWLGAHPDVEVVRHFARDEASLEASRENGRLRTGADLADLNLYYQFRFPGDVGAESIRTALLELNAFPFVETAFLEPVPSPPVVADPRRRPSAGNPDLPTPDYTSLQGYLQAPPAGINAQAVWGYPGGRGATVRILDIEGAWLYTHEDLKAPFFEGGPQVGDLSWRNHGTAVLGEMVGGVNGYGVTGIAADLQVGGVSIATMSVAAAIDLASAQLDVGDLFLIELHAPGPNANGSGQYGYVPMEYWQDNFDAIQTAVAEGRICVEAGGNGEQNLDDPVYQSLFDRGFRYSGAIMVGAGTPSGNSAEWFTNYGSRLDLNGWGSAVVTTGYGDLQGGHETQWYTGNFGGTSSASPIVAGAVASLQGMCRAVWNLNLSGPLAMRLLYDSGTPWNGPKRIGRRPDLVAARAALLQGIGSVSGLVRDAESSQAIAGAEIRFPEYEIFLRSDSGGQYAATLPAGSHAVAVTDFFHYPLEDVVEVLSGQNTAHDLLLAPKPTGSLEGTFLAQSSGQPIAGGSVFLPGTPIPPVNSGISPDYAIPGIPAGTGYLALYGLIAGHGAAAHFVDIAAGQATVVNPVLADAQTFEGGNGGYAGDAPWAWGTPTGPGPGAAFSGTRLWATDLDGNYGDDVTAYLYIPPQDCSSATRLFLTFTHWYEIEGGFDGGNVQVRQGPDWVTVEPAGGYPMAGLSGLQGQSGYSGASGGWLPAVFDLTPHIGASVEVRFHFGSDAGVTAPGWYIDDVAFDLGTIPSATPDPAASVASVPRWVVRPNPFSRAVEVALFADEAGAPGSGPDQPAEDGSRKATAAATGRRSHLVARIFDPAGRQVRALVAASRGAGGEVFAWDGRDAAGRKLPSGAYLCRVEGEGRAIGSRRLIKLDADR